MWFKKKEDITPEWLIQEKGFEPFSIGIREGYVGFTDKGSVIKIYPYRTESDFDFFWTLDDKLLQDLKLQDRDKVETMLINY